jgi:hypothetical protein
MEVLFLRRTRRAMMQDAHRRSLAAYRMVFGQPRQEDLAAFLGDRMGIEEMEHLTRQLRIDLAP